MDQLQKNLNNLHHFWLTLGGQFKNGHFEQEIWPNHFWLKDYSLLDAHKIQQRANLHKKIVLATIEKPCFDAENTKQSVSLEIMNLGLDRNINFSGFCPDVKQLTDLHLIQNWVDTCSKAFGYQIDIVAIKNLLNNPNARLFAYLDKGFIAGTAISYQTGDVLGLHQVGVHPNYQGMGIAKKMMSHILAELKLPDIKQVSLQASKAGLKLYQQLGFISLATLYKVQLQ
ncbi:GNAT family N-acetyltransferase [Catenovulum sp. 2E275]|uniref:GNAT family N-acetyltransferase n=1 Tax=Catenovulum sp. 2E275 TaxID=2980497 RepID=UPI0021CE7134|nr:GNAT family N-acetyltransferase [Catenovulum sp. 2E275]MCU4675384.1 GNAT family N-acetyltransferase [Catenovulum sp. 2E275]